MAARWRGLSRLLVACCVAGCLTAAFAEPASAPPVSQFAPAEDLTAAVDSYLETMTKGLATAETFAAESLPISRSANALIVVAQALAAHDQASKHQRGAAALLGSARELSEAKDLATAQAAFGRVKDALAATAATGERPTWSKVARMGLLMKEVTLVNNRLRRSLRRFEQKKADNARDTAMLAIIAQAIAYDTHEVKDPALVPQWESLSAEMRDAAGLLNRNIHDGDEAAAQESLARLTKSCEDCHKAFRVEVEP